MGSEAGAFCGASCHVSDTFHSKLSKAAAHASKGNWCFLSEERLFGVGHTHRMLAQAQGKVQILTLPFSCGNCSLSLSLSAFGCELSRGVIEIKRENAQWGSVLSLACAKPSTGLSCSLWSILFSVLSSSLCLALLLPASSIREHGILSPFLGNLSSLPILFPFPSLSPQSLEVQHWSWVAQLHLLPQ